MSDREGMISIPVLYLLVYLNKYGRLFFRLLLKSYV